MEEEKHIGGYSSNGNPLEVKPYLREYATERRRHLGWIGGCHERERIHDDITR
jgi:hypothetical protein